MISFEPFEKIARLKRELVITEKLDGTNAQVAIAIVGNELEWMKALDDPYCIKIIDSLAIYAGSRTRWIAPEGTEGLNKGCDNFGFALWVKNNAADLVKLGPGRHYGEWYGQGIQRNYGLQEKRFALFNVGRWTDENKPDCCEIVYRFDTEDADEALNRLQQNGSFHVKGFDNPEGIIIYHTASRTLYKYTLGTDGGKWRENS